MKRAAFLLLAAALPLGALPATAPAAIPQTPVAELVSGAPDGSPTGASDVVIAGGGRFAVFTSDATTVLAGQSGFDTNGTCDVFRRDLMTGATVLVSKTPGGAAGSACSSKPRISSEGSVVAFATSAANLITAAGGSSPAAGVEQVLVADLAAGTLTVASRADGASGALAGGRSSDGTADFSLSGDGSRVAFVAAGALQPGVAAGTDQVWLRDLAAGTTTLVSAQDGTATTPITETARTPSVDQYGVRVAFATSGLQVLVREPGETTTVASQTTLGDLIDGASPALSAAGNAVAFTTRAPSFSATFRQQVVVRDLTADTTTLASHPAGAPATAAGEDVGPPSISGQGRVVAFASTAANLAAGSTGGHAQVYVADLRRDLLTMASTSNAGSGGNADSSAGGEGTLLAPSMAQDGITVASTTRATDLVTTDATPARDAVIRRVRVAQSQPAATTRSASMGGLDGRNVGQQRRVGALIVGEGISDQALSGNGRYVAFQAAIDRYAGDPRPVGGGDSVVYVRDRLTGEVESVSRESDAGGRPGELMTRFCVARDGLALSESGRYVAFCSGPGLYRRDRETGTTIRVDVPQGAGTANGDALEVGISANGRYVAFASYATNLVPGTIANGLPKLYLRDVQAGTTVRIDLRDGTTDDAGVASPPGIQFSKPSVTDDGRYVAFEGTDASLVSGTGIAGGFRQAYLRDVTTDRTYLLNRAADGSYGRYGPSATGQTQSSAPRLTPDGRYVVFASDAGNLVAGKTNTVLAIYRQRLTFGGPGGAIDGALDLVSVPHAGGGAQLDAAAEQPSISADGVRVAFIASASNLVSGVLGGRLVYTRDLPSGTTALVSRADGASGATATGTTILRPELSADGSIVLFDSSATNLDGDTSNQRKALTRTLPVIAGTAQPTNSALPAISPGAPRTGEAATCGAGTWTGTPSYTYEWLLDGALVAGATEPTYVPGDAAHLKPLRCRVTATNAAGSATATSPAVTVTRAPPTVTVTGTATFAETVTCDPGRWAGDGTLSYAWLIGDGPSEPGTVIPSAAGSTFDLEEPQVERWVRCRATIIEAGTPTSITSAARYVRPEVTVLRGPAPLTAPREGEAFTCSDTELRVRPAGLGVRHQYYLRTFRTTGEIASESGKTLIPAQHGPLGFGSRGTQLVCVDEGTVGASTSYFAAGSLATIDGPAPPTPTPTPAPVPELPRPTSTPSVSFATPMERFCRAATFDAPLQGLQVRFAWTTRDAAGRETAVPASQLKAGLLGDGQVFTGVARFGGFGSDQPVGVRCTQILRDPATGRERSVASAVVRPQPVCTKIGTVGGNPGKDGIPIAVYSVWCEAWSDEGRDVVVEAAPPLPAPPLVVAARTATATIQLGCGSGQQATGGCTFTATLYAVKGPATKFARRQQSVPAITTATRRGARLAVVRGSVRKGQRTATVRLRVRGAAAAALRRGRSVPTILVVAYGRGKARPVAAPILTPRSRTTSR
jgi:Tol biopolymer transport system component